MKIANFESIAEIVTTENPNDWKHPLLTTAKFVFIDDKGNSNGQGVEASDFPDITRSAIGTPVKMKFIGKAAGHQGSIPIGHISSMTPNTTAEGLNQLVAIATLYAEEFPYEVQYLKDAFAAGEAPGISFEMLYGDSVLRDGIQWLKKLVTKAATFVDNPAYGTRTGLMALASDRTISDEEFNSAILQMASEIHDVNQGGKKMTDQEIKELQDKLAAAELEVTRLTGELTVATTEITDTKTSLEASSQTIVELQSKIDENIRNTMKADRTAKMVAAGFVLDADAEKAATKQDIWLSLSEEAFQSYLEDYIEARKSALATKETQAEARFSLIPRPVVTTPKENSYADIKGSFRQLSRPERAIEA